jgi:hypothetical protein
MLRISPTFFREEPKFGEPFMRVPIDTNNITYGKLDYIILKTKAAVPLSGRYIPSLGPDPKPDDDLAIVQDRVGRPVEFVRRNCHMTAVEVPLAPGDVPHSLFSHVCDTAPSSSGSPIFDQYWRLVGMHIRGGKSDLAGTTNVGLFFSSIVSEKPDIGSIISKYAQSPLDEKPTVSAALQADIIKFSFSSGETIVKHGDSWSFQHEGGEITPLYLQESSGSEITYVFWSARSDEYIEVPKSGGEVKSRKAGGGTWRILGTANRS